MYSTLRKSLVAWENISDVDSKEPLEFSELNQKIIFEYVKNTPELFTKVVEAYGGITLKN